MAHIQTEYAKLWKPQDLSIDKISSQKMFIDNVDIMESFALSILKNVHQSVNTLDELKAINTSDTKLFTTGMLIMVNEYGIYSFNRDSTATASNAVVVPNTGGGRWIATTASDIALSPRQVNSTTELDTLLTNVLTQMSPDSVKFLIVKGLGETEPPLYGGAGYVMLHKSNNLYATLTMIIYNHDRIALYYTRTRYDGIWGRWVTLPYLDENGKIPLSQIPSSLFTANTLADAEVIS